MIQAESARVVDPDMQDVPADGETLGEVVLRGNNVMIGYYRDPETTREAFRGGWFHSGDVAVLHPDGAIELRDRMKDVIISGGENISTVEVEQALMSHPDVLEVAVVAVPDEHDGRPGPGGADLAEAPVQPLAGEVLLLPRDRQQQAGRVSGHGR